MISRLLFELILLWLTLSISDANHPIAKHGCPDSCGNVSIPYPFGIGPNCFHDSWYEVLCNTSFSPNKPFLSGLFNLEVMEINMNHSPIPALTVGIPALNICSDSKQLIGSIDLDQSPYRFSGESNIFEAVGCGGSALFRNRSRDVLGSCASFCPRSNASASATSRLCGVGCCQTSVSVKHLNYYEIGFDAEEAVPDPQTCMLASLSSLNYHPKSLTSEDLFPTELSWVVRDLTINYSSYPNSECIPGTYMDSQITAIGDWSYGYVCSLQCAYGYEGNPYIPNGCQVIKGCEKCHGHSICSQDTNVTYQCQASPHSRSLSPVSSG